MIDAEHSYFQPAIDNITTTLARKYNRDYPVVFNTYQMYLVDSLDRLRIDVQRAKKHNYKFAAKLVRGIFIFWLLLYNHFSFNASFRYSIYHFL